VCEKVRKTIKEFSNMYASYALIYIHTAEHTHI